MSESEAMLLRLGRVETDLAKHFDRDEKEFRYSHNMLEDLGARLAGIERSAARFEADLAHRSVSDKNMREWLTAIEERLRTVERLVWIAVGGVVVLGGIITLIGGNILRLLAK